jgi:hypothetical protein
VRRKEEFKGIFMKYALLLLCALVFVNVNGARADEGDDDSADDTPIVAAPPADPPPVVAPPEAPPAVAVPAEEEHTQRDKTRIEMCLNSIFYGQPTDQAETDDIVVVGTRFDTNFATMSNLPYSNGDMKDGKSYFLTKSGMLSPSTSFDFYDSTNVNGEIWHCGGAKRLRRLGESGGDDNSGEDYDPQDDDDAADAAKTTSDVKMKDQWGNSLGEGDAQERKAIYYVKANNKSFRIDCAVSGRSLLGLGVHKNKNCQAHPVNTGSVDLSEVKSCEASDWSEAKFIEKSLRRREKSFNKNVPESAEAWAQKRAGFIEMKQNCSSLIADDDGRGARDALHDLAKKMNDKISKYNKKNGAAAAIAPLEVPSK